MASRIEIGFREGIRDALGEKIRRRIIDHLRIPVDAVRTVEVYTIDAALTPEELERAACGPLSDPVIQDFTINRGIARGFDWLIEVGFRPGVTDNVGKTAAEAITLLTGKPTRVYTSRQYAVNGVRGRCSLDALSRTDAERIASELLANDLIQRYEIIEGRATGETLVLMEKLALAVQKGSLCGLGKTAPNPVLSTLRYFRAEYEAHVFHKHCETGQCKALAKPSIDPIKCKGCMACAKKCPVGAIHGERKTAHVIDQAKCIVCGVCATTCKLEAVVGV